MAIELKGYSNQINQASMLKQGLENLRHADREQAREHLADLRRDLQTKSGVVRLLHTTKTDKDMKFKNAGAFKRMFLSGDKLRRSGDVITDLLRNAGLSEAKVEEFGRYAANRGNKGVEAQKVLQYIDALQADAGESPAQALAKFGVNLGAMGRELGAGAYGEVHLVSYRGEEFVYKNPLGNVTKIGELALVGEAGKEIKPDPVILDRSFTTLKDDESFVGKPLKNNLPLPRTSIDEDRYYFQREMEDGQSRGSGDSEQLFAHNPPPVQQAQIDQIPQALIVEEDAVPAPELQPLPSAVTQQKLARTGLANAARVKDLPQVITPSVFVVKEGRSDGKEVYHAVAGQRTLKDWAKLQNKGSSFDVVGLLMPKAAGKNPVDYPDDKDPKVNVSRSDLKSMAQSAMTLIKGMAQHGFIHGDIKPENLIWDSKAKNLQLIDNDNLVKVSKRDGSTVPKGLGPVSLAYLHPLAMHEKFRLQEGGAQDNAQLGLGRDLYATGLVLLETSLRAGRADSKEIERIMNGVAHQSEPEGSLYYQLATKSIESRIEYLNDLKFPPDSVQHFARTCLIKALEFEQDRIDRKDFGFDRSENGREAALIRELEAALQQVR